MLIKKLLFIYFFNLIKQFELLKCVFYLLSQQRLKATKAEMQHKHF